MLNKFKKTLKDRIGDALMNKTNETPGHQEETEPTIQEDDTVLQETTPAPASWNELSDEEILAKADAIRARIAQAEAAKHQQEIDAEQNERYKVYSDQNERQERGRRENLWNSVHVGINAQTPSIMDEVNKIFGDSISDEMKGVVALLILQAQRQENQINPLNVRFLQNLSDYVVELRNRNK